jgi:hypothetical protein
VCPEKGSAVGAERQHFRPHASVVAAAATQRYFASIAEVKRPQVPPRLHVLEDRSRVRPGPPSQRLAIRTEHERFELPRLVFEGA